MRCDQLCLPKDFGGPGISNTKNLNDALLLKWVWRILDQREGDLCCQLLRAKYLGNRSLMNCNKRNVSQFWRGVQSVKHMIRYGVTFKVQNGRDTIFWDDLWISNIPLRLEFPSLYTICNRKDVQVSEFWDGEAWDIPFCRSLGSRSLLEGENLMDKLELVHLQTEADKPTWVLEKSGRYSTRSAYRLLSHRGITNKRMKRLWACRLPMKLKIFLWACYPGALTNWSGAKTKEMEGGCQLSHFWGPRDGRPHHLPMRGCSLRLGLLQRNLGVGQESHEL